MDLADSEKIDCVVTKSRRIAAFEADHVEEVTDVLAQIELITDVALIKHVTEYSITNNVRGIKVEFED